MPPRSPNETVHTQIVAWLDVHLGMFALVNLLQHGRITYDRPVRQTPVHHLTELVAAAYRTRPEIGSP